MRVEDSNRIRPVTAKPKTVAKPTAPKPKDSSSSVNALQKEKTSMIKGSPSKAPAASMPRVTYKPKPKPKPQPKAIAPAIGVKIYDSVKSGKIKLDDLNDDGVRALREHMERTQPGKYGDSSGNVNELRSEKSQMIKQNPKSAPAVSAKKIAKNVNYKNALPGRNIPVIGPILKGLDAVGEKVEPAADIMRTLYTPGAGLANVTGFTGAVGSKLAQLAPNLGKTTMGRIGAEAVKEGVTGVPLAMGQSLAQGGDLKEAAKQGVVGGVLGAGGGAAFQALSPVLGKAFNNFITRHKSVAPETEQATKELLTPTKQAKQAKISGPLKPANQNTYIDRVMSDIRPIVTERMTPPLENPKELAKWLQPHLGDTSLNELRKLSYDDMVELAHEVKNNLSTYEMAKLVATERGYNIDDILSGKLPSIKERVKLDASKRVYGIYDAPKVEVARPKTLEEIVHGTPEQTSKMLDEIVNSTPTEAPKKLDEIVNASQAPKRLDEIVNATTEQAVQETATAAEPMKQNWFTNLFGNQGLGISALGSSKKISMNPLTTEQQIVKNPLKRDMEGTKTQVAATVRAGYQNFVDQVSPLKHISPQTYEKALDARRANNIANTIVEDKFVTPEGVVVGEGLGNTFRKVGRGQSEKFNDYIVLRHAKTRMERGEKVYADNLKMTPEKVQERIDMYNKRYPGFAQIAKEWDKFNENMLKTYGVDEGLMSEEMFTLLRQQNPNYAPMRRQFSTAEKFASPLSMGAKPAFSGQKSPIKEVSPTGSVRRIVDPRRSTIEATGAWVNAALRNRVMKTIVDKVKADPEGMQGIVEIVQKPKGQRNLKEILADEGAEGFLENINADFDQLFKRTRLDQDNIVRAMIKGEPVYLKVHNPEAVKALVGMGAEQSNVVMDAFGHLSNAIKHGATGFLAPMFAVKSLTVDTVQAMIQSKNAAAHMWDLGHAIISSLADTLPKNTPGFTAVRSLAQDYKRMGGQYSAMLRGDRPLNKSVRSMQRNPILSPKAIATGVGKTITAPFKALHKVADISENLNRMAAAKGELRRLGGERTPDNVTKAMSQAREVTTNYSRMGTKSQQIEKFIPYSNAAVQGMYRFATAWKKNPVKTAAMVGTMVMMPKAIEYMRYHDDPDYQNIPARERYRNLFVNKNSDGTFVKVPMPPEYNALGSFMVDSLKYIMDNNPEAFKGAKDALADAYTPPLVSGAAQAFTQGGGAEQSLAGSLNATVLSPIVATLANKDYAGRPIEPMELQDRSPQYRHDERTSVVAKKLGRVLKMSPKKVDYLIRSFGGDPARLILPLTSEVGGGEKRNTLLKNFITDPVFTNNLTNDFYGAKEKLSQAYRDHEEAGVPLPSWYDDKLRKLITSRAVGSASKRLSELSDMKKEVNLNKSLSAQQKARQLRNIQSKMNNIYLEVNSQLEGVPKK